MPKKVLELCLSPDLGGLELYMVRASHFLHAKTGVISVINSKGKLEQYYEDGAYVYEKLERRGLLLSFLTARKLAAIIDANAVDVVHLHWTNDIPTAVLAKLMSRRKPKLVQTRNMTMTRFKDDLYHRWLYKNLDMMLPVTYQVKAQLEKFIPEDVRPKIEVLYMGAESPELIDKETKQKLRGQYGLGDDVFTVGIVGRIERGKGQYLVIDAVRQLITEGAKVQALIVGHAMDEAYLDTLKADVERENLQENIIFTGFSREPQKLMQLCDTVVLATESETFGLVLIEAMRCAIAVIGTDNAGPIEIIDDHQSGLLFKKNSSGSLAEKIRMLLEDPELKMKLAYAGKQKADEMFESTKQFEKLSGILERL
jgi:L-malate glycosyltransferase